MKQNKRQFTKASLKVLVVIPILLSVVACDGTLELPNFESNTPSEKTPSRDPIQPPTVKTPQTADPATPVQKPKPPEQPIVNEPQSDSVKIYWLTAKDSDLALSASSLELEDSDLSSQDKLSQALKRLFKGPANANVSSAIPEKTKLYKVSVKSDGVHVNLSKDFTSGGGSLSMQGRLGQVIYTASSLSPQTPIWISIEGEPLQVLGGEGLEVPQPMTRKEFDRSFSI